jgi:hypothetical protein
MSKQKVAFVLLVVLTISVGVFVIGREIAKRNIRQADFGPLSDLLMGRLGEMLTVPAEPNRADARLFTTYRRAVAVVDAVRASTRTTLPKPATDITNVSREDGTDGWGNPFCIIDVGGRIAAVSSGGHGDLDCIDLRVDVGSMATKPPGRFYRYPTGELVFISAKPI